MGKPTGVLPGLKRKNQETKTADLRVENKASSDSTDAEVDMISESMATQWAIIDREQNRLGAKGFHYDHVGIRRAMIEPLICSRGGNIIEELTLEATNLMSRKPYGISRIQNTFSKLYLLEDDYVILEYVFRKCANESDTIHDFSPYAHILNQDLQVSESWYELMHRYYMLIAYVDHLEIACHKILHSMCIDAGVNKILEISVDAMIAVSEFAESLKRGGPQYMPLIKVNMKVFENYQLIMQTFDRLDDDYLMSSLNSLSDLIWNLKNDNQVISSNMPKMYPGEHSRYGQGTDTMQ